MFQWITHRKVNSFQRVRKRIQHRHQHVLVGKHNRHPRVAYLTAVNVCEKFLHLHACYLGLGRVGGSGRNRY